MRPCESKEKWAHHAGGIGSPWTTAARDGMARNEGDELQARSFVTGGVLSEKGVKIALQAAR